jgi:hypothetical protein
MVQMHSLAQCPAPEDALLKTYRGGHYPELWGKYSDCFSASIDRTVGRADFVFAFYTSPVFKIERLILHYLLRVPSGDDQAKQLAVGSTDTFAVWPDSRALLHAAKMSLLKGA